MQTSELAEGLRNGRGLLHASVGRRDENRCSKTNLDLLDDLLADTDAL